MGGIMQTVFPIAIGDIEIGATFKQPLQHIQMAQFSGQMDRVLEWAVMGRIK